MADLIQRFLAASAGDRLRLAADPIHAPTLKAYLGDAGFEQYVEVARRTLSKLDASHLAHGAATNLLFVPGIMGSLLLSRTLGGVWWIDPRTRAHLDDLRLAPD